MTGHRLGDMGGVGLGHERLRGVHLGHRGDVGLYVVDGGVGHPVALGCGGRGVGGLGGTGDTGGTALFVDHTWNANTRPTVNELPRTNSMVIEHLGSDMIVSSQLRVHPSNIHFQFHFSCWSKSL